jgi:hypothetical protein
VNASARLQVRTITKGKLLLHFSRVLIPPLPFDHDAFRYTLLICVSSVNPKEIAREVV